MRFRRKAERLLSHEVEAAFRALHLAGNNVGRWVAFTRDEILAVEDTAERALAEARKRSDETPILWCLADPSVAYFFAVA